jgi:putative glutamine amidotransferase
MAEVSAELVMVAVDLDGSRLGDPGRRRTADRTERGPLRQEMLASDRTIGHDGRPSTPDLDPSRSIESKIGVVSPPPPGDRSRMPTRQASQADNRPSRPLIGVTMDLVEDQARLRRPYLRAIEAAGGIGVPIAPVPGTGAAILGRLDGLILSGGDDPDTTVFGEPVHPKATLMAPDRQSFELELLDLLDRSHPDMPVLGICLGMQLMGLHAGGRLDQHLPDSLDSADLHWNGASHDIAGRFTGTVHSHHRQALVETGSFEVVCTAPDGVIEAIEAPGRRFRLGVQWHPERTDDPAVGASIFEALIRAAGAAP